jgi:hypothetical protein
MISIRHLRSNDAVAGAELPSEVCSKPAAALGLVHTSGTLNEKDRLSGERCPHRAESPRHVVRFAFDLSSPRPAFLGRALLSGQLKRRCRIKPCRLDVWRAGRGSP